MTRFVNLKTLIFVFCLAGCDHCSSQTTPVGPSPSDEPRAEAPRSFRAMEWHFVATSDGGGEPRPTWYDDSLIPLEPEALLTAENVISVRQVETPDSRPALQIQLDEAGAATLAQVTGDNIDRQLALVIGDRIVHAPRIREAITGGAIQVSACSGLGIPEMYRMITEAPPAPP